MNNYFQNGKGIMEGLCDHKRTAKRTVYFIYSFTLTSVRCGDGFIPLHLSLNTEVRKQEHGKRNAV